MEDRRDVLDVLLGSLDDADRVATLARIEANHTAQRLKIIYGSAGMPGHPLRPGRSGAHPRRASPDDWAARIRIFTSYREQVTTVYVYDAAGFAAAAFRAALDRGMHAGQPLLVVDLDGVSFLDPAGLEVLCRAAAHAARRGKRISVRRAQPAVYQAIIDAGLVATLDVHPARANSQGKRSS
jgi:anti-anti-sigma factor